MRPRAPPVRCAGGRRGPGPRLHLQSGNNASVGNATVGNVSVEAVERDASGKTVASIPPVRKNAEIEACQLWEEDLAKAQPTAEASERADAGGSAAGG